MAAGVWQVWPAVVSCHERVLLVCLASCLLRSHCSSTLPYDLSSLFGIAVVHYHIHPRQPSLFSSLLFASFSLILYHHRTGVALNGKTRLSSFCPGRSCHSDQVSCMHALNQIGVAIGSCCLLFLGIVWLLDLVSIFSVLVFDSCCLWLEVWGCRIVRCSDNNRCI